MVEFRKYTPEERRKKVIEPCLREEDYKRQRGRKKSLTNCELREKLSDVKSESEGLRSFLSKEEVGAIDKFLKDNYWFHSCPRTLVELQENIVYYNVLNIKLREMLARQGKDLERIYQKIEN